MGGRWVVDGEWCVVDGAWWTVRGRRCVVGCAWWVLLRPRHHILRRLDDRRRCLAGLRCCAAARGPRGLNDAVKARRPARHLVRHGRGAEVEQRRLREIELVLQKLHLRWWRARVVAARAWEAWA